MHEARRSRAHTVARGIERTENCCLLSGESISHIEDALAAYAIERLKALRSVVVADTLNLAAKGRAVELIDAAIRRESE